MFLWYKLDLKVPQYFWWTTGIFQTKKSSTCVYITPSKLPSLCQINTEGSNLLTVTPRVSLTTSLLMEWLCKKINGSDVSSHAPLCTKIVTYISHKKLFFVTSNSICYGFHCEEVNGNTAIFIYESLYVLQKLLTLLCCLNFYCC